VSRIVGSVAGPPVAARPCDRVRDRTFRSVAHVRYDFDHAFATALKGSDNIVSFHTKRYSPRPLIIQGAGAGADVTAMGCTVSPRVGLRLAKLTPVRPSQDLRASCSTSLSNSCKTGRCRT
jgi:homoserine dehydrogenase